MDSLTPEAYALLEAIADGESSGSYNTVYGGGRFKSFSDHPNKPVLIRSGPNAGKYSTAAGKYQILAPTWREAKKALGLTDFSPASQDRAAWYLAQKAYGKGLQKALEKGDLPGVAKKLSGTWTSLPHGIEAGRSLPQFTANFNRSVAQHKALVPPADIPATAVASQLDVRAPQPPRQKPAAVEIAQAMTPASGGGLDALQTALNRFAEARAQKINQPASAAPKALGLTSAQRSALSTVPATARPQPGARLDPLQSALERYAAAKAAKIGQAPNTTIPATVQQMNDAKSLLADQLRRLPNAEKAAAAKPSNASTLATARAEQALMRARPAVEPAPRQPVTPTTYSAADARAEQALMRNAKPTTQPPTQQRQPTVTFVPRNDRPTPFQQANRAAVSGIPIVGSIANGLDAAITLLSPPAAPKTAAPTPAVSKPSTSSSKTAASDVIRVTPEGLNVRGVQSVAVDKYGVPVVTKTTSQPKQPTEAEKRALAAVPTTKAAAPKSQPKAQTGVIEFVQKFGSNTGTPAPLPAKPPKTDERLPKNAGESEFLASYYPDKAAAKRSQDIIDALYPRPATLPAPVPAPAPAVRLPMAKPAAITLQQQRVVAPPMPRPRPAPKSAPDTFVGADGRTYVREKGRDPLLPNGTIYRAQGAPAQITVNGGRQLVPQQQPSLIDRIVTALTTPTAQETAYREKHPITYDQAPVVIPGTAGEINGIDMAFMPNAVQTSSRWRTGY